MTCCIGDELSGCDFGDARLTARLIKVASAISDHPETSINAACGSFADSKGAYRLLQNDKVRPEKILRSHQTNCWERAVKDGRPILAIQDTTDLIYTKFPSIKGLGERLKATKNFEKGVTGLMLHSTLAVSIDGVPLGLMKQTYFTYDEVRAKRNQVDKNQQGAPKNIPITEKASYRWLEHLQSAQELATAKCVPLIHVADRECDIYEFLHEAANSSSSFVVRSCADRLTQGIGRKVDMPTLGALIQSASVLSNIGFTIEGENIECEVKRVTTVLRPPHRSAAAKDADLKPINVSVVDVRQTNCDKNPIHWRLLTNLPCESLEDCLQVVKIYGHRWAIECFHRILKSGFHVEEARLANRQRIENFATLLSIISWHIFWLYKFGRSAPGTFAASIIDKDGIKVLTISAKKLKIKISSKMTLGEALLIVARLGGFLGRKGDGDPGMQSIWRGWRCLAERVDFLEAMTYG